MAAPRRRDVVRPVGPVDARTVPGRGNGRPDRAAATERPPVERRRARTFQTAASAPSASARSAPPALIKSGLNHVRPATRRGEAHRPIATRSRRSCFSCSGGGTLTRPDRAQAQLRRRIRAAARDRRRAFGHGQRTGTDLPRLQDQHHRRQRLLPADREGPAPRPRRDGRRPDLAVDRPRLVDVDNRPRRSRAGAVPTWPIEGVGGWPEGLAIAAPKGLHLLIDVLMTNDTSASRSTATRSRTGAVTSWSTRTERRGRTRPS